MVGKKTDSLVLAGTPSPCRKVRGGTGKGGGPTYVPAEANGPGRMMKEV